MSYTLFETNMWKAVDINNNKCRVPHDWHLQKVSDLAYHITTGKKDANAAIENGIYPFYTCGEKNLAINEYSFDTNALVLNGNGAVGDVKMATGKFDAYQRNYVLTGGLPLKYSYYVFKKFFKHAVHLSGSVMPYITLKDLQKFEIRIPPLPEQTAIANILSDQEALIAQYDNLIALHEKRFAYLSDELLSGRLNLQKNEKGLTIGEGPTDNWLKSTVKNAVSILNGYPCSSTQMSDDFVNGVPILKMSNIEDGAIVLLEQGSQKYFVDPLRLESVPQKNDMLVGLSGSVGKSGVFGVKAKCIVNQRIAILRVKDANFDQDFFNFMWVWCLIDALLKNVQSSTIGNVSTKDVEELSFSHPPLEEQTLIANVLSDQEALIAQYKKLRDAEKKRFDWLSDALLSGTYRVKVEA